MNASPAGSRAALPRLRLFLQAIPRGSRAGEPDVTSFRRRRMAESTQGVIGCLAAALVVPLSVWLDGHDFPLAVCEIVVIVLASLVLSLRWMLATDLVALIAVAAVVLFGDGRDTRVSVAGVIAVVAVALVGINGAYRRQALGLGHIRAETVIEKLRAQLRIQGEVPPLPAGWHADVEQRAAHRAAIAGDFISTRVHDVGGSLHLDLVVVDVSGKGIEAGTRALLLSGAMGGLLGSVGPDEFLAEANNYLRRQAWAEGFASAVYVRVNLSSGLYSVRSAGHPPALHMNSQTGGWRMSDSKGILLGVVPEIAVRADYRTMRPGDALLLYTDGVVEDPRQDLSWGTERLMRAAESLVRAGDTDQVARRLVVEVPTRLDDDRAVVMIWRDPA